MNTFMPTNMTAEVKRTNFLGKKINLLKLTQNKTKSEEKQKEKEKKKKTPTPENTQTYSY